MNIIYAEYNTQHNNIDIATTTGYLLRIGCWKIEKGLETTPCPPQCALDALAIDEPLENARHLHQFTAPVFLCRQHLVSPCDTLFSFIKQ